MTLKEEKCIPCREGGVPLGKAESRELVVDVPCWTLSEKAIEREFRFHNFREAMAFVDKVAETAEDQGHHPDIHISYNHVKLELTTHKIDGLSRSDFIMAAKIDGLGAS